MKDRLYPLVRPWIDRAVNLSLIWTGSLLAGSGLVLKYRVGYTAPRRATVWGLDGEGWGSLHWILSLIMLSLLALHLTRHRRWLWVMLCSKANPVVLFVAILALALLFAPVLSP